MAHSYGQFTPIGANWRNIHGIFLFGMSFADAWDVAPM